MTGAVLRLFDDVTNIVFTYSIWGVIVMIRNMQIIDSKWDLSKFSSVGDWLVSNFSYQSILKIFFANDEIAQDHLSESYSLIYITCITLFILNRDSKSSMHSKNVFLGIKFENNHWNGREWVKDKQFYIF